MKLTPRQRELIEKMREGWELRRHKGMHSEQCYLTKDGERIRINGNTFWALYISTHLLGFAGYEGKFISKYTLTPKAAEVK